MRIKHKVVAFPKGGTAYTECLYSEVERQGIVVLEGIWAGRWLLSNIDRGDILHIHWPSFHYVKGRRPSLFLACKFVVFTLLVRLRGGRVYWTAHNLYPHDSPDRRWLHRLIRWFLGKVSNLILVHGIRAQQMIGEEFGVRTGRFRVIPHGDWTHLYPNEKSRFEARKLLGLSQEAYLFGFVGYCKQYKGLEDVLWAIAGLGGVAGLVVAGKFESLEYREKIESLVSGINSGQVWLFPGYIPDDEIQLYMNAVDAVVLPFADILTSGSAVLALSFYRPLVAPNLGCLPELIDSVGGELYQPEDRQNLLAAMKRAMEREWHKGDFDGLLARLNWADTAAPLCESEE